MRKRPAGKNAGSACLTSMWNALVAQPPKNIEDKYDNSPDSGLESNDDLHPKGYGEIQKQLDMIVGKNI